MNCYAFTKIVTECNMPMLNNKRLYNKKVRVMQTFGTNYRNCATCGRWAGQRSTDTFGSMVQTMPNAQPIINHCVQNAETWCHEHILNASNHATGMSDVMQGTAEVHGEILSAATG